LAAHQTRLSGNPGELVRTADSKTSAGLKRGGLRDTSQPAIAPLPEGF
jgi:hypothetical protein